MNLTRRVPGHPQVREHRLRPLEGTFVDLLPSNPDTIAQLVYEALDAGRVEMWVDETGAARIYWPDGTGGCLFSQPSFDAIEGLTSPEGGGDPE